MTTTAGGRGRPFLSAILVIVRRIKPVFELETEFDRSNPYMKFKINPIKNDYVRVTTTADGQTDEQTDGQTDGQAENNRAPPTVVGGALIK